ncbi:MULTISPECIES: ABC transporter ATP-binding protein [Streptomyces]|uniref:ABC transporter ATP-binding protein n=1 Tax=Streptomyces TaxID=1883 RepID=UPI000C266E46|nr:MULTISPECIES: ABC transporter ATP-binding protein [unclassified Streptomyces]NEE24055.1 ABC transporter ATP-binding protein [Streptomyces sp. SID7982]NEE60234.1 ABC transporter ATP-binding protein [Streptomyces sp. SID8455]WSU35694.1 ABC transporter ATP-binding protein [Streptomyces gougerotii]MDQ0293243.1 ABC-type multidrug transport system ATPase subunit [Streptomyces sp. DSM 41037]PJM83462.1 ABC transporter ATP-binding protein [Streptomyces sp. TSRI0384-2]
MNTTTIRVAGLRVRHRRTTALDGVDLEFPTGVHGLLGPNGAGKTSLIRVLATAAGPAEGRVEILGHDLADRAGRTEVRRRLGYLPQHFGHYPRFTVREFVSYMAWLKEVPADTAPWAVARALDRVGLTASADTPLKRLSGGMVRRAGIAQALVNDPAVLLLDEPTAGLDPEQRLDFRALLRSLAEEKTVLVSTHLVEDVAGACTTVTLLDAGRLALRDTPEGLARKGGDAPEELGGNALERGYTLALRDHRSASAAGGAR